VHALITIAVVAAGAVVVAPALARALALSRALALARALAFALALALALAAAAAAVAIAVAVVATVSIVAVVVVAVAEISAPVAAVAVAVAVAIVPDSMLAVLGDAVAAGTVNHGAGMMAMSLAYSWSDHTKHCGCVVHEIAGDALFLRGLELVDIVAAGLQSSEWIQLWQVD